MVPFGVAAGGKCQMMSGIARFQLTSALRMRLEALQHTLNRDGLLAEHDKDEFRTHPSNRMDTSAEGDDLALSLCLVD
jgi:hypothetical protein